MKSLKLFVIPAVVCVLLVSHMATYHQGRSDGYDACRKWHKSLDARYPTRPVERPAALKELPAYLKDSASADSKAVTDVLVRQITKDVEGHILGQSYAPKLSSKQMVDQAVAEGIGALFTPDAVESFQDLQKKLKQELHEKK